MDDLDRRIQVVIDAEATPVTADEVFARTVRSKGRAVAPRRTTQRSGWAPSLWAVGVAVVVIGLVVGGLTVTKGTSHTSRGVMPPLPMHRWAIETVPSPHNVGLTSVSCPSTTFCMAVGSYGPNLAEVWNGRKWRVVPTPPTVAEMAKVSCASPDFCVSVSPIVPQPAAMWNGKVWHLVPMAALGGTGTATTLVDVSCPSTTKCVAVGASITKSSGEVPFSEVWDGRHWSVLSFARSPQGLLLGISCPTITFCMAMGNGIKGKPPFSETYDGNAWHPHPIAHPVGTVYLPGVSCISPTWCMAVGWTPNLDRQTTRTVAERWDGTEWSTLPTSGVKGFSSTLLTSVSCTSPTQCVAAGTYGPFSELIVSPFSLVWNGLTWAHKGVPLPKGAKSGQLHQVSCVAGGECFGVGSTGLTGSRQSVLVERYTP